MNRRTFSPSDICQLLMFSKSTLFRWEKDGLIAKPERKAHFTSNDERAYSQEDLALIAQKKYQMMSAKIKDAKDDHRLEVLYRVEFFFNPLEAISHLIPLASRHLITEDTLKILASEAFHLSRSDPTRHKLFELILLNG